MLLYRERRELADMYVLAHCSPAWRRQMSFRILVEGLKALGMMEMVWQPIPRTRGRVFLKTWHRNARCRAPPRGSRFEVVDAWGSSGPSTWLETFSGGGFLLACEESWGKVWQIIHHLRSSPSSLLLLFKVEISFRAPTPLFRPGISSHRFSELTRLWMSIPRRVACELVSLLGLYTVPGQHSQPTPTSLDQGYMSFLFFWNWTCHLHLRENDRGLLRATVITRGWNGQLIRLSTKS